MGNKKIVFITIVVLLCIFLPLTVVGFVTRDGKNILEENPNHETFFEGHIYFYDDNDKYLSKYECVTEICGFSTPTIDDGAYGIKYYKEGTIQNVSVIEDNYTFITDGAIINLYNVVTGKTLGSYKSLKNYNTTITNNAFILQNEDGLWGVLNINNNGLFKPIDFEYDFVGLANKIDEDKNLRADEFIVKKDNKWYIVDNQNNAISGYIDDPIIEYNDRYIFSKNTESARIYSYNDYEYLTNYKIKDYILEDKYIGIITDNFLLIYDDLGKNYIKSITLTNVTGNISLKKSGNKLDVLVGDTILESIELL